MCSDDEESHIETLPMLCGTILAIGEIAIQITWAQLFKDQLALIRGRILIRFFFFLWFKRILLECSLQFFVEHPMNNMHTKIIR